MLEIAAPPDPGHMLDELSDEQICYLEPWHTTAI